MVLGRERGRTGCTVPLWIPFWSICPGGPFQGAPGGALVGAPRMLPGGSGVRTWVPMGVHTGAGICAHACTYAPIRALTHTCTCGCMRAHRRRHAHMRAGARAPGGAPPHCVYVAKDTPPLQKNSLFQTFFSGLAWILQY